MSTIHLDSEPTEQCSSLITNRSQDALSTISNLQQSIGRMDIYWQGGESGNIHSRYQIIHRELEAQLQELSNLAVAMQREIQQWIDTDIQGANNYQGNVTLHPLPYRDILLPILGGAGLISWFPSWMIDWYRLLPDWLRHFIDPNDLIPINDPIRIIPPDSLEPVNPPIRIDDPNDPPIRIDDPVHEPGILDPNHPPVGFDPQPIGPNDPPIRIDDPVHDPGIIDPNHPPVGFDPAPRSPNDPPVDPGILEPIRPTPVTDTPPLQPGENTPPQDTSGGVTVPVNPPAQTPVSQPNPPTYSVPAKGQGSMYGNAGCSPTSVSMVLDYYHNQNPSNNTASTTDLISMLDKGDGTFGKGISLSNMTDELADLGYNNVSQGVNANLDQLKEQLSGGPVIVTTGVSISGPGSVRGGDVRAISGPGNTIHAMVVTGISSDGSQVMVNDPWSGQAVTLSSDTFSSMWSRGANGYYSIRP